MSESERKVRESLNALKRKIDAVKTSNKEQLCALYADMLAGLFNGEK